jgi:hypothetical protein
VTARRAEGVAFILLQVFGTLSAIAGGIALMTGAIDLPTAWLEGTIFSNYVIPGIILATVVGGSQLAAIGFAFRRGEPYLLASAMAGGIMMGWIVGELLIVGTDDSVMFAYQLVYFLVGFLEFAFASMALRQGDPNE